jgi:hypothetical protein
MRPSISIALLACGGCLLPSVNGFGSTSTAASSGGATSNSAGATTSATGSSTTTAASSGSPVSGVGSTSGGSATTGGSTTGPESTCGGSVCQPNEFCYQGSYCQPFLDCSLGGGPSSENSCLTDGGALGSCCGSACINLDSEFNCGVCGAVCPSGAVCGVSQGFERCLFVDGGCNEVDACPLGDACLPGVGCLAESCDGTNRVCSFDGGVGQCCGYVCASIGIDCGGSCPLGDVRSTANYGCIKPDGGLACSAGAICPPGSICSSVEEDCVPLDICATVSPSSGLDCPFGGHGFLQGMCCGTACTDTSQDPNNCSGCGNICPSGICVPLASVGYGIGQCLPSAPTDDCPFSCPSGSACVNGACIDGSCDNATFCLAENGTIGMCCEDGACAHPLDDPLNCGACGNACGPDSACIN